MTENIPPIPQAQPQGPAGAAPYQHYAPPPSPYGERPYPPPYGQQQPQHVFPPQRNAMEGHWTFVPAIPKSSGYRVAAGIIAIVLGFWMLMQVQFAPGFLAFLSLVAAAGNTASGIVLLAKQRGRLRGAPVTVLSFAGFALLVAIIHVVGDGGLNLMLLLTLLLGAAVLIVMGLGLSREKRGL